jgi:putative heme-binding domain-containing protein
VVARDYLMTIITTRDGRTVSGLVKEETERTVVLQTATQEVRIAKTDIDERTRSTQSLMPEGMLDKLNPKEIRDLIGYLAGADQVELPK